MPDITSYNGIDMANIASINGQDVPSGGGYSTATTGLLLWGYDGAPGKPIHPDKMTGAATPQSFQIEASFGNAVQKIVYRGGSIMILLSNGDLYSAGTQQTELGRTATNIGDFTICNTGVTDVTPYNGGYFCIKGGALYYTGGAPSTVLSGLTASFYSWTQYGTDTDYIRCDGYDGFAYKLVVLKGSSASTAQLYGSGYNQYGQLGNGLTSGTQLSLTLFKTSASTDFTEYIKDYSCNPYGVGVVTNAGDIYTCGYGTYGHNMNGSSSNVTYMTQPSSSTGISWDSIWMRGITAFAINAAGELYASPTNAIYYTMTTGLSNTKLLQKIGTDTDWEHIQAHTYNFSFDQDDRPIAYKKGGEWYVSALNATGWNGSKPNSATDNLGVQWKDSVNIETPVGSSQTIDFVFLVYNNQQMPTDPVGFLLHVR